MKNADAIPKGDFSFPNDFRLGAGRIKELALACGDAGIRRPLLVVDAGIANGAIAASAMDSLVGGKIQCAVFADVKSEPAASVVDSGVAAFRRNNCDGAIGLGGGSALDSAKAIAFAAAQTLPLWEFEDVGDKWKKANAKIPPIIAVPTTAGTGSEVGRAAVISRDDTNEKKIIFHPKMLPQIAIADPELIRALPPPLTAATGFDALAHAVEALCAPTYHPFCEGIALNAIALIHNALPRAFHNGGDLSARANMLSAAAMGAIAFQKGLGAVHSLSHPLGAIYHKHHGLLNAVLLPYVLAWNRAAIEDKLKTAARLLNLNPRDGAGVIQWIIHLRKELKIPHTLAELEMDDSRKHTVAQMAMRDATAPGNPIPMGESDFASLFDNALRGELKDN